MRNLSWRGASAPTSTTLKRLAAGAIPAGISTAVVAVLPFAGRFFLDDNTYAIWALLATVGTVGLVFDFGAPALATRAAARSAVSRRQALGLSAMSASGSVLIGCVAAGVWPIYVSLTQLPEVPGMQLLLLAVAFGSGLRSIVTVGCGIALGQGRFVLRGVVLLTQAMLQIGITFLFLATGAGLISMIWGQLISAVVSVSIVGLSTGTIAGVESVAVGLRAEALRFLRARGVAALIGLSFTQLDRWIVGLVATPSFLATYDVASRLASIPKIIILTLGLSYVLEAARTSHTARELQALLRKLLIVNSVLLGLSFGGCALLVAVVERFQPGLVSPTFMWLFLMLGIVSFANSMTAPGVMVITGRGHPEMELTYLIPSFVVSLLALVPALMFGSVWAVALSLAIPLTIGSVWFVLAQNRLLGRYVPIETTHALEDR